MKIHVTFIFPPTIFLYSLSFLSKINQCFSYRLEEATGKRRKILTKCQTQHRCLFSLQQNFESLSLLLVSVLTITEQKAEGRISLSPWPSQDSPSTILRRQNSVPPLQLRNLELTFDIQSKIQSGTCLVRHSNRKNYFSSS